MAIRKTKKRALNAVKIICLQDGAIDEEASDFDLYRKDPIGNADALKFLPNEKPTYFICNFEVSGKEMAIIKDSMTGGVDDEKNVKTNFGKWAYTVVKMTLKVIDNPPEVKDGIELKFDSKRYVSDATMTDLEQCGVLGEIFQHWITLTQTNEERANAKN